jgi:hypothetical protein
VSDTTAVDSSTTTHPAKFPLPNFHYLTLLIWLVDLVEQNRVVAKAMVDAVQAVATE